MCQKLPRLTFYIAGLLIATGCVQKTEQKMAAKDQSPRAAYAIAIHGGAGAIPKAEMTPEKEIAYRAALDTALAIGEAILQQGGKALDAVEKSIVYLENNPLFNAGRGAVFTHDGQNELDASIMDGRNQAAGAVGSVMNVKNPIILARAVMEKSPHVFLTGRGAEQFARENGIEQVDPSWFYTKTRWESLEKARQAEGKQGSIDVPEDIDKKYGTVGCVVLDKEGNLAAGTSTGGMTNKRWNRLGDTPVIGAGTYADNNVCAVSCTGHGEFFIRYAVAHDVWALMQYKGMSLAEATNLVVNQKLVEKGGEGGLIAVDKAGNIAMPFNSAGMFRASIKAGGEKTIAIY